MKNTTRPPGVTAISILCWLLGAADLFLAVVLLATHRDADLNTGALVGVLFLGLVYVTTGIGLFRGVDAARVVALLGSLVSFATGLYAAGNGQLVFGIATVAVTVIIAILLWTGRGSDWFVADKQPESAGK